MKTGSASPAPSDPTKRKDIITIAHSVDASQVFLRFADGVSGTWSLSELEIDPSNLDMSSIVATEAGASVQAKTKRGDVVQLDSATFRALVDPAYRAELDEAYSAILGQ
jgi:hypothetical protein